MGSKQTYKGEIEDSNVLHALCPITFANRELRELGFWAVQQWVGVNELEGDASQAYGLSSSGLHISSALVGCIHFVFNHQEQQLLCNVTVAGMGSHVRRPVHLGKCAAG